MLPWEKILTMPVLPRRDSEVNPGAAEKVSESVRIYRSVGLVKRSYEVIIDQTHTWGKWQHSYIWHQRSYLLITIRQNHTIQVELAHKQGPGSIYFMIPWSVSGQCWNVAQTSWLLHIQTLLFPLTSPFITTSRQQQWLCVFEHQNFIPDLDFKWADHIPLTPGQFICSLHSLIISINLR